MGLFNLLDSPAPTPRKSETAYKTISEVSDILDVPQHVLRFWESNFPQLTPSRMRGSRRYYSPEDVALLQNIKTLLYTKGYTIKGARNLLKSKNVMMEEIAALPATQIPLAPPAETPDNAPDIATLLNELRVLKSMLKTVL